MAGFDLQGLLNNLSGLNSNQFNSGQTGLYNDLAPDEMSVSFDGEPLDTSGQSYGDMLSNGNDNMVTSFNPVDPTASVSDQVQQIIGTQSPPEPTMVGNILAQRNQPQTTDFGGTNFSDYINAAIKSITGTPTLGQDITNDRMKNDLSLAKLGATGMGGSTGALYQMAKAENPNLTIDDFLFKLHGGYNKLLENGPNGIQPMMGGPESLQTLEQSKGYGSGYGREGGKNLAKAQQSYPTALVNGEQALYTIDQALSHPGFDANFGMTGVIPNRPGSDAANAKTFIDQVKGQNFLTVYDTLRGAQAITDLEGKVAQEARARLVKAQDAQTARAAFEDLRDIITIGLERMKAQAEGKGMEYVPNFNSSNAITPQDAIAELKRRGKI